MRIKIPANIALSPDCLIKRCGYAEIRDRAGKVSYVHRVGGYRYPRFHIYIEDNFFQPPSRSESAQLSGHISPWRRIDQPGGQKGSREN